MEPNRSPKFESVSIRPAGPDDLPAIVAMRDDLNALELSGCQHAPIQKLTLNEFTEIWAKTLTDPDHCWRLVEDGGKLVGFGLIYLIKPRTRSTGAFIHWAYLDPDHRRQGLGRLLLDHLTAWAKSKQANRIELQFIEGNDSARGFWTRLGFRSYASKCVYYLPE